MIRLKNELANVKTVAISGHIRPDGDCIGSCLGVWNYIQDNYPDIQADVYQMCIRDRPSTMWKQP